MAEADVVQALEALGLDSNVSQSVSFLLRHLLKQPIHFAIFLICFFSFTGYRLPFLVMDDAVSSCCLC